MSHCVLGREQIDVGDVILLTVVCRVARRRGRDHDDHGLHLRRCGPVKRGETDPGGLPFPHLVDIGGRDLDLELEFGVLGNDGRDLRRRRNDAADRVHEKFVDVTRDGRSNFSAGQTILDRQLALAQLGDAGIHRAQVALRLGAGILVDSDDLHF